eukprot:Gb_28036 [translate_table: standard]
MMTKMNTLLLVVAMVCVIWIESSTVVEALARNGWNRGHATFYGSTNAVATMGGACGYDNVYTSGYGIYTAALSSALFREGAACGACFEVMCDARSDPQWCIRGRRITITATNFCPANTDGGPGWCNPPLQHLDMSMPAFNRIARGYKEGVVRAVWVRGSGSNTPWQAMRRNWGANWQSNAFLDRLSLSFRITAGDGKTLTFNNAVRSNWRFGQTFATHQQF